MATNYAVRITYSYAELQRAVVALAIRCDKILAYEHVGTATEKVHVHMILVGVRCDIKTLKDDIKRNGFAAIKGNAQWSFKTRDKKYGDVEDSPKYITYMTKGTLDPKYNKGYTVEQLEEAKKSWVDKPAQKNKDLVEYYAFREVVPKDLPLTMMIGSKFVGDYAFSKVRDLARKYAFAKVGVWNARTAAMGSMLYKTYCMFYDIPIPNEYDRW